MLQAQIDAIFDLDGTLVDSATQCELIIQEMRSDRGVHQPIAAELARQYSGIAGPIMVPALLGEASADADADLNEFRARYAELRTPASSLYPGVAEGLERLLKTGVRLSICSAKPQNLCERVLADTGILDGFSVIYGGDRAEACKPDRRHLLETLKAAGGSAERALLIGDSETDRQLAKNAQVPFAFVTYGYAPADHTIEAEWTADTFEAAVSAIMQFAGR